MPAHRIDRARGRSSQTPGNLHTLHGSPRRKSSVRTRPPRAGQEARSARSPAADLLVQVELRVSLDQGFRQRRSLDQKEPVVVVAREFHGRALVHCQRRRDVKHHQLLHRGGMIECKPVRNTSAPVMATNEKTHVAQAAHQLKDIERHDALAVWGVVSTAIRLVAVAIATQIRHDQRVMGRRFGAIRCHIACVCGKPCNSSSGGPRPPWRT